jgi:Sodium:solute symporter family
MSPGGGVPVKLLTGMPYQAVVVLVGAAMVIYVAFGGMLVTTWVQIVKAVLMLVAAAVHFDHGIGHAAVCSGIMRRVPNPVKLRHSRCKSPEKQPEARRRVPAGTHCSTADLRARPSSPSRSRSSSSGSTGIHRAAILF